MVDEGSRMSEEYYIAVMPMLSVVDGTMDVASTPAGKLNKDGSEKFFYKCSKDPRFVKRYVSAEDCPRHSSEFLALQKERMSRLAYAQEYLAVFTDALKRLYSDELINKCCVLQEFPIRPDRYNFLGVDVAGFGDDACTYESIELTINNVMLHRSHLTERRNLTTDTTNRILQLHERNNYRGIGVDDGGVGFGVFSELLTNDKTKRVVAALNNARRMIDRDGNKSKKLLKEEMHINMLRLMEQGKVLLLDNDEVRASLASMQYDDGKIFGSDSHIAEGLNRAVWMASKAKNLNMWITSIKV
jgi:hypothetical protein